MRLALLLALVALSSCSRWNEWLNPMPARIEARFVHAGDAWENEKIVASPVEALLAPVPWISRVESWSMDDSVVISLETDGRKDATVALEEVRAKLAALPSDLGAPTVTHAVDVQSPRAIRLDVCGRLTALAKLRDRVDAALLEAGVRITGETAQIGAIFHVDRQRCLTITGEAPEGDRTAWLAKVRADVSAKVALPPGTMLRWSR